MNVEEIIKKKYKDKISSPSKLIKAIKESDKQLIEDLQQYIEQHQEYQKISYLILAICKNKHPKKCLTCGKQMTYSKSLEHDYCSNKCAQLNNKTRMKIEQTCLKKYGVKSPTLNSDILLKRENNNLQKYGVKHTRQIKEIDQKIKETNIEKYGYITPSKNKDIINKIKETNIEKYGVTCTLHNQEIQEKVKQTMLKKYGVDIPLHNKEIKLKKEQTCLQRYGVTSPMKNNEVVDQLKQSKIKSNYYKLFKRFNDYVIPSFTLQEFNGAIYYDTKYKWKCVKCGTEFYDTCYSHIPRCLKCYPINTSKSFYEKQVFYYLKEIYDGEIKENDRELINPLELDIVIPGKKLAIEFNR